MPDIPERSAIRAITDPKERLIAAGARLLVDDGFRVLAAGLSPERVCQIAGRSRRTFYEHFDTKEDFARAVLVHHLAVRALSPPGMDAAREEFASLLEHAGGDIVEAVEALTASLYPMGSAMDEPRLQFAAWAIAGSDPEIRDRVAAFHQQYDQVWESFLEAVLESWDLELRDPWTTLLFAQALRALLHGSYTRSRMIAQVDDRNRMAEIVLTMAASAVQRTGDPDDHHVDRLRSLSRAAAIGVTERRNPAAAATARARLLEAMAAELEHRSLPEITLAHVADRAGVGITTVRASFPDVMTLFIETVRSDLPALARAIEFDLRTTSLPTTSLLRRHLTRLRTWAVEHPALVRGITMASSDGTGQGTALLLAIAQPVISVLRAAAEVGAVRADADLPTVAILLTQTVLSVSLVPTGPTDVGWIVDLLFEGLAPQVAQ